MSEAQQSRASVVRVKGVSFNYLQFLWSKIGQLSQEQAQGNYAGAMGLAVQLIRYLPDSMKEEFRDRAIHINMVMNIIRTGRLEQIQQIPDFYLRGIYKNRLLQIYSSEIFQEFIDDMTTKLNKLGYMENLKMVAEGDVDSEPDWMALDKQRRREQRRRGRRSKKPESPVGEL